MKAILITKKTLLNVSFVIMRSILNSMMCDFMRREILGRVSKGAFARALYVGNLVRCVSYEQVLI